MRAQEIRPQFMCAYMKGRAAADDPDVRGDWDNPYRKRGFTARLYRLWNEGYSDASAGFEARYVQMERAR